MEKDLRCLRRFWNHGVHTQCVRRGEECAIQGDLRKLVEYPCCEALSIPARFLLAARDKKTGVVDRPEAVKMYLGACFSVV